MVGDYWTANVPLCPNCNEEIYRDHGILTCSCGYQDPVALNQERRVWELFNHFPIIWELVWGLRQGAKKDLGDAIEVKV